MFLRQSEEKREVFTPSAIDPQGSPRGEKSAKGHRGDVNKSSFYRTAFMHNLCLELVGERGRGGRAAKNDSRAALGIYSSPSPLGNEMERD